MTMSGWERVREGVRALRWTIPGVALLATAGCGDSGGKVATPGGSSGGAAVTLDGAGSSFVYPAMSKWAYAYKDATPGTTVNYQSVGSGAGVSQYQAGTVDFAASDAPLGDEELAKMPVPTVQFPVTAGCEVLAYNLPGVGKGLKLSGDVVADVFLGRIKNWNDPRIAAQNPGVGLPAGAITVAHRSDGSGTTYVFTDYLSAVSPVWKGGPGKGKTVNWPVGVGGKGNEGVAGLVKQTPGSIGYVELAYALQAKLDYGPVRNAAGEYVTPSVESTTAAANAAKDALAADVRASIVNGSTKDAYPIAAFVYMIVPKTPKDAAKGVALDAFVKWVLGPGQGMAAELQYAPLPDAVVEMNRKTLGGGPAS